MATMTCRSVEGQVTEGFEGARTAFADNFARRRELGGACSIYQRGEKIVDLWGGVRDRLTGEPWERDTMVIVYSATKGLAAMTLAIAHSRGWLDYEARVSEYWPEFAQHGKGAITVRQLLAHQAGLYARPAAGSQPRRRSRSAGRGARRQTPAWEPNRQAYGITLGFYERAAARLDPAYRSLGQFFRMRSPRRLVSTSTSGCPRTSRIRG
jgi:CubicO group peptidase (beta-lactamase class C family)